MQLPPLHSDELVRYGRQLVLPGFGVEAQKKLKQARVLVIGAGGLGIPVLQYLVAAGIGTLGVVDFDTVELSNLHRQVIYRPSDEGSLKVIVTKQWLSQLNPHVTFNAYPVKLTQNNVEDLFKEYDIIVDGTDNIPTRLLINDVCVKLGKPTIYGAIFRFEGQVSVFNLKDETGRCSPNYRDLFPHSMNDQGIPNCAEAGVIGLLPGIVGNFQAMEVLKIVTGIGEPLAGKLLMIDTLGSTTHIIKYKSTNKTSRNEIDGLPTYPEVPYQKCGTNEENEDFELVSELTYNDYKQWIEEKRSVQCIDVRLPHEPEEAKLMGERIPLPELLEHPEKVSRSKQVVLYCLSGERSTFAAQYLQKNYGFKNIFNLKGGIEALGRL